MHIHTIKDMEKISCKLSFLFHLFVKLQILFYYIKITYQLFFTATSKFLVNFFNTRESTSKILFSGLQKRKLDSWNNEFICSNSKYSKLKEKNCSLAFISNDPNLFGNRMDLTCRRWLLIRMFHDLYFNFTWHHTFKFLFILQHIKE